MTPKTWKAFCMAIISMTGPEAGEDKPDRVERSFKCDRCLMTWSTAMPLEGVRHLAIQNKCGGKWGLTEGGVKCAASDATGSTGAEATAGSGEEHTSQNASQ